MNFTQKIYCNNKPLILTNDAEQYIQSNPVSRGYERYTGAFARNYRLAFEHLARPRTLGAVIEDLDHEALETELHKLYTPVDAGGGVVQNEHGDVLMIYRRGKWDLPKGKCDDGEAIAQCAVREVSEETGLQELRLGQKIGDTYHVYAQKGEQLLKRTSWYHMKGNSKHSLQPQAEENILEARWIAKDDIAPILFKSYEAIREVLKMGGLHW